MSREIVFIKDGKEVDSVDPYYSHVATEKGLEVEGGVGHHLIEYKTFDEYIIREMETR